MIAAYVQAAADAPLVARPSIVDAEVRAIAERDRVSLFAAALAQWRDERPVAEPELAL